LALPGVGDSTVTDETMAMRPAVDVIMSCQNTRLT